MGESRVEAVGLVKDFGEKRAVDGITSRSGRSIYGMPPHGRGQDDHPALAPGDHRSVVRNPPPARPRPPMRCRPPVRLFARGGGLYPNMTARDAIAFMGGPRGLSLREGRRRADDCSSVTAGEWARKPIDTLSRAWPNVRARDHRPRSPCSSSTSRFRARRDQPGEARGSDPRARAGRCHHIFSPCHRPLRAAVRAIAIIVGGGGVRRRVDEARAGSDRSSGCVPVGLGHGGSRSPRARAASATNGVRAAAGRPGTVVKALIDGGAD